MQSWRSCCFIFSLEFYFVTQALKFTSTSHTVVLLYTAPIFVALGLHWKFPTERLNRAQWGGIVLALWGSFLHFTQQPQLQMRQL